MTVLMRLKIKHRVISPEKRSTKMNSKTRMKCHKFGHIKQWWDKISATGRTYKVEQHLGAKDPMAVLSTLTLDQMVVVLSMVSAANSIGWDEQRAHTRSLKVGHGSKESRENRLGFRVIKGGAA